ncbi:hypothetical protein L5L78_04155 [Shewanella sp. SM34]|uniref:hypothetical protein n=1 Tax=unclassified Shewanella TaxID=196818 RepID=UPI0021D8D53E|nr:MULTISPECIES: hypothetical protein [unclassified Shewanella]MCU8055404.1 hypothetical protein [Shewanella sp. SM35]MCU8064326.1 hypothetical protein [Shewanella sp. SM34]
MSNLSGLDVSKLRKVKVIMNNGLEMEYLCLDLGEGVWREQDDVFQAHTVRMVRRPNSLYTPKWQDVVSKEYYSSHEITDFLPAS